MKTVKKSAIYVRVSTDAQREEGYSIDAQKQALAAYCVAQSIKDYEFFEDGGFSGSNMNRPELQRLIKEIKSKQVERVLVYRLDRLSRSQKDTLYLIEDVFNPHGVDFVSLKESMDTATPIGRLMVGILSAFAQLERENIRERTRMGMKERVKEGYWMGGGRIPFGYDYDQDKGILVPNKDAVTVRKIYDLYIQGYSCNVIAQMLGLKYERLVMQILTRKSNCGFICYNGEEYKGKHEPIIDLETYEQAMECMRMRSITRSTDSEYLLTGKVYCGKCGAKMRYQKWGKAGSKLVCYSTDKSRPLLVKDPNCNNLKLWASDVEDVVIQDLFDIALGKKKTVDTIDERETLFEMLNRQYDEMSKKIKKLYNLYAESDDDLLLETIEDSRKKLTAIGEQIEREKERSLSGDKVQNIQKTLSTIRETWDYMTPKERKSIVQECVDKVVVTGKNIEIYYKFKTMDSADD